MSVLYPRLDADSVVRGIEGLEERLRLGLPLEPADSGEIHADAQFPAEGNPVSGARLRELRNHVLESIASLRSGTRADELRELDASAGRALNSWFEVEGRGQAAHPDIWPYLTIMVLPDVAVRRFPPDRDGLLARARFAAGRRNVFHRLYLRSWVLGPLLDEPDLPIFEDDLVGLIDRNLSADHQLARLVSEQIFAVGRRANRRDVVREGFKALQFELRVTDLGALSDADLRALLAETFQATTPA
ncbi:hypothetical protein [Homoserinibacter sp. YIM 151385]|uniref:hypothetical protein n=1 Tax=Homoserinibacter sp. YIM 151385 TaxID=2985506 RepID=UPI0022F135D6|nr:hypothetical protein [Homoserinibacter sp. YIM 151385]WBU38031.1 hypothetical protein OF852_00140 [Homoserinibacter sp. YIM 151385]